MNYKIKLFSELNDELKNLWNNVEEDSYNTCFNSQAWLENYLLTYGKKDSAKLKIFVLFLENKPICIFPFQIIKKFKTNILQWACDINSDFNSPVQKKNFIFTKSLFKEIWEKVTKMMPEIDVIYLKRQIDFLGNNSNPFIYYLKNYKEGIVQQIFLPDRWEKYTSTILKKKFYLDLMRTKKLLKKEGKVEFIVAKNYEEKISFIDVLINQKNISLKKINAKLFNKDDLNFYKNFEKNSSKKYQTQISAIKLDGEFIAMHWGMFDKVYYYYLLPSMKEDNLKKFSPGKLLLSMLIRLSISKKIKTFDFGLGEESYKSKWTNNSKNIYNYIKLNKIKGIPFYILLHTRQLIKYLKNITNK